MHKQPRQEHSISSNSCLTSQHAAPRRSIGQVALPHNFPRKKSTEIIRKHYLNWLIWTVSEQFRPLRLVTPIQIRSSKSIQQITHMISLDIPLYQHSAVKSAEAHHSQQCLCTAGGLPLAQRGDDGPHDEEEHPEGDGQLLWSSASVALPRGKNMNSKDCIQDQSMT